MLNNRSIMQPSDTRSIIMQKSFELLLIKGFDGVSISDIQQYTGISRGLLYHYFGNKETLFIEAITHHFTNYFTIDLDKVSNYGIEQLMTYIVSKYRKLTNETLSGTSIINYDFLVYRAMQQSRSVTKMLERMRDDDMEAWTTALNNSLRRGEIRKHLNIEKLARQFTYTTDGVWFAAVTPTPRVDLIAELDDALTSLYSLIKID